MPKRSKSSERWLQRQRKDYFVRKAQDGGQVSRAHYKLAQIDERFNILSARKRVLELGAAPGGWTQYLESKLTRGFLIAVDPLPITRGSRCRVVEGYAGEDEVNAEINQLVADQQMDLVLSDMAPNISGVRAVDQAQPVPQTAAQTRPAATATAAARAARRPSPRGRRGRGAVRRSCKAPGALVHHHPKDVH